MNTVRETWRHSKSLQPPTVILAAGLFNFKKRGRIIDKLTKWVLQISKQEDHIQRMSYVTVWTEILLNSFFPLKNFLTF